jgi:hypothetical protein
MAAADLHNLVLQLGDVRIIPAVPAKGEFRL